MYLQRLDILGFKSFANKTHLRFSSGVTAIVGPNGCGKTNVLDALRWVLGEQRPTLLRGGRMEEVIFNGTRDLKPLGMAEVSLTVVNDRGVLPTEYSEVQISRRLFRSGESEYLLNKIPCRLKDISDLFTDTGMGAHSYSVIQQDMIDSVISDKAEERRFLFEEAAGITKYKQRKKAALRKLEATESDFLRLKDIHSEVKTQVNSLFRQHKKAERYQKIADNIKQWDLYLSSTRFRELEFEKRRLRAELDALTETKIARSTQLDQAVLQLEVEREQLLGIEHELNQLSQQILEATEIAHRGEQQISILREKKSSGAGLIERNRTEITSLSARVASLDAQLADTARDLASLQAVHQTTIGDAQEAERAQAEADSRLIEARSAREIENRKLIDIEARLSSGKTEENSLREQESELSVRLAELDRFIAESGPNQQAAIAAHESGQQNLSRLQSQKTDIERKQTALNMEMEGLIERSEELGLEISNLSAAIEACEARRNLLNEMMLHYEGHESGLVAAMSLRQQWPGIVGTVAEKLVPVEGLEMALESALGNLAGFMICRDRTTAEDVIRFLKHENKGRVGILVPDAGILNPVVRRPDLSAAGFVGWLESFVSTDAELRPLMEAVLSRVAVFKAGTNPDDILPHLPYGFSAVSTDGVLYSKNVIVGGSDDRFPLFRRREKVLEQEQLIHDFSERLQSARDKKNHYAAEMARLRADSAALVAQLEQTGEEIESAQKELGELEFQRRTLAGEIERWERERTQLRNRTEALRNRQGTLGLDFDELARLKSQIVDTMGQSVVRLDDFERAVADSLERVARTQVAVVEARSRVEQTESRMNHLREIAADIQQTIDVKTTEITRTEEEIASATDRIGALELELKSAFERRQEIQTLQETEHGRQAEVMARTATAEKGIKELREAREAVNEQMHGLEIRLNTVDSEATTIGAKAQEDYQVEIASVEIACPDPNMPPDKAREYLHEQKDLLRKFGAVNLLALEEYRTAAEREKFLGEQLNDLTTARDDLQVTITKINLTARQLFMETFDKARTNFQNLFQELFSGGEADIRLETPDDPLESNIEISARPRGKKLLSITMMSGGERALTAISLLFALYLVKPSPFCILDEIDAPLDDANCHRFLKIIKKFSGQTQFITITHNKITMEAADNLYGITMEQPGVSKLVAVKFSENNGNGDNDAELVVDTDETVQVSTDDPLPAAIRERLNPGIIVPEENES